MRNKIFDYLWIHILRTGFILNSFWIDGIRKITLIIWQYIYIHFNREQFYINDITVNRILNLWMKLMSKFFYISASINLEQLLKNKITHYYEPILIILRFLEVYIRGNIIVRLQKLVWLIYIHWYYLFLTVDRTRPLFICCSILISIFLPFRYPLYAHDVPNLYIARLVLIL